MKVVLRQPRREVELDGIDRVQDLFRRLELVPESYLAIRAGELLTVDMAVGDEDVIELRPVISGGSSRP
jgi:sulfur carrier protein